MAKIDFFVSDIPNQTMEELKKSVTFDPEQYKLLLTGMHFCILSKEPTYPQENSPIVGCEYTEDYKGIFEKTKERFVEYKGSFNEVRCKVEQRKITIKLIPLYKSSLSSGDLSSILVTPHGQEKQIIQTFEKIPFDMITDFYILKGFNILVFSKNVTFTNHYGFLTDKQRESNFVKCLEKSKSPAKVTCNH